MKRYAVDERWRCDRCGSTGAVKERIDPGVFAVVQKILTMHRIAAPTCAGGRETVRIIDAGAGEAGR